MFSARSTTLYGIGLRLLTSGEGINHHLRRAWHISATIWRHIEQFETICDEFGTFETSFRPFWGFDWWFVMIGDDERRKMTVCGQVAFILGRWKQVLDQFEAFVERFGRSETKFRTFAVDWWRLHWVEMIAGIQPQSYTTILGSQYDCFIATVDQLQA